MPSPLIALLQAPDRDALDALLAEAVRFHSPVADYEGRADVAHLLSLIATVVHDVQPTRELEDGTAKTTFISGDVEAQPVQGVLDERYDEHGLLIDATLMLRPLATLRIAVAAMAAALDAEPLPSAR
jgi:hypothetical protein